MKNKIAAVAAVATIIVLAACTSETGPVVEPEPGAVTPKVDCDPLITGACVDGTKLGGRCHYPNDQPAGCPSDERSCTCQSGLVCYQDYCCQPIDSAAACAGKVCGAIVGDGCGGIITCGPSNSTCTCATCQPNACGTIQDGCGNAVSCGGCKTGYHCGAGFCHKNCAAGYTDCNGDGVCVKTSSCM